MRPQRDAPDEMDVYVGAQLKRLRKRFKITQGQLAEALGVTFQQIQKYESGANRMAASTLSRAAMALKCSVMDFYPATGGLERDAREVAIGQLIDCYDRMGATQKEALLHAASALAGIKPLGKAK